LKNNSDKPDMQIILLKDISKLGKKGEVKNVTDGYGLNFLLPQKLAAMASASKLKQLAEEKARGQEKIKKDEEKYENLVKKFEAVTLELKAKVSDNGKLFAGLGASDIARALSQQKKIEIDKKFIKLPRKIKNVGEYKVNLEFGSNLKSIIKLKIKAE